jgi:hypothetical protein
LPILDYVSERVSNRHSRSHYSSQNTVVDLGVDWTTLKQITMEDGHTFTIHVTSQFNKFEHLTNCSNPVKT